jgi:hypothetical protein
MTAIREHWRRCVAEVAKLVGIRDAPLTRQRLVPALVAALQQAVRAAMSDGRALAALQDRERAAAVTVARCETGFATGRASVAAPHEAAFVADHADELRAIGEAIRAAEAAWPTAGP